MSYREIVVRHDGPAQGWSVWVDGERASVRGVPRRKVAAFADGLETGIAWADPDSETEVVVEDDYAPAQVAMRFVLGLVEVVADLTLLALALGGVLLAIANLVEVIRVVATDWDGSHFAEHVAIQVVVTSLPWAYFTGRMRSLTRRWRGLPRRFGSISGTK